jgi:tRNA threonylcarbamoyladenosine biosynthesis protein TsaB
VALLSGARLLSERTITDGKTHSIHLMPLIHELLEGCRWVVADLSAMAVTRGPGTFTGLRIGISTVKGLAAAVRIPVVGISSLAALAFPHLGQNRAVVPLIDARRGEVYYARYSGSREATEPFGPIGVAAPEAVADDVPDGAILIGSGAHLYRDLFRSRCPRAQVGDNAQHVIRAASVGRLALVRTVMPDRDCAAALVPDYIRKSDAQIQMSGSC